MNKDLFLYVYKNKVLNIIINNQIRYIHKKLDKHAKKFSWNHLTPEVLSHHGYYDQLKKLEFDFLECGKAASRNGHIHILKYIYKKDRQDNKEKVEFYKSALRGGNIPIIEYIYNSLDTGYVYLKYLEIAAIGGVDVCEWVVKHHEDVEISCNQCKYYQNAALSGNLDTMKWGIHFFKINYIWSVENRTILWGNAIQSKNISLLEFMYNHEQFKSLFDLKNCMLFAARYGNFDVMDWVFSKSDDTLSLDENFNSYLVQYGSIRVIKYFSGKLGCNNNNIAEWFFNKCEQHGINAIDYAICHKNDKIIIWLYEQTNYQSTLNPLGNNPSLDIIQWFTENNRPERIPTEQLDDFVNFDYISTVKYMVANMTGQLKMLSKDEAISIIDYIIRYRTEQFPDIPGVKRKILLHSNSIKLLDMLQTSDVSLSEYDFDRAISSNRINSVKWIHNNTTIGCTENGIESAYFLKDSAMIEWLHQNRLESCNSEYIKIKFNGCSTSVKSFIIHNKPEMIPSNVLELVGNSFSLSKFIIDNYPNQYINQDSLFYVSKSGNVEIVKYLYENHSMIKEISGINSNRNPMLIACIYGSLDICKYLHENTPFKLSIDHIDQASINGHLHLVQWIYENHQIKCSNNGFLNTALNEHYNVVRYLLDNGHFVTSDMFKNAIINSDLELVKIYETYQCKLLDFNIIDIASEHGQFEIIKYCFDKGHRGTNNAIDSASEHGHLDIIKFLRNNGHKCTSKSIKSAYYNKHKYVVKWLLENIEFPTSEMPTIDHYYNESEEILKEYINKQKLKENENNKKRDFDSTVPPRENKKTKK